LKRRDDAFLTWADLESEAQELEDEQLGRAALTYNSYLDQIGAVLKHARVNERSAVGADLDPSLLRRREDVRARSKRYAFQPDEINALFQHPVWQGCRSEGRGHERGNQVIKDGLFFVPLMVAYSGGRMEEIAGLTVDAIVEVDGQYGFDIRSYEERRIKNAHSARLIPLHEHLLELGLLDHRDRMTSKGERLLFSELRTTSAKKKFMSALRYNWRNFARVSWMATRKVLMAIVYVTVSTRLLRLGQKALRTLPRERAAPNRQEAYKRRELTSQRSLSGA